MYTDYPGKLVQDSYIGLIYVFDEPTVLWAGNVCEFVVSTYVVVEDLC